ncbi:MAG: Na+/H+ antiporter subunit E [Candidatus Omnitrophota bacterium]
MKMHSRIVTFIVCLVIWCLLSFSLDWQHLLVGVLLSLFIAAMTGDLFTEYPGKWLDIRRYGWFLVFLFLFAWECLKANVDVAMRVINPRLPINPGIVKVRTALKTETALTLLANFITLTPGTLSVDIDNESGHLYIHWIDVRGQDVEEASRRIALKFERILGKVLE